MFDKVICRFSVLFVVAVGGVGCSGLEDRRSSRSALPPAPTIQPQARFQPPRNTYIPPAFEEYRPQSQPRYNPPRDSYESYVPEKNYDDAYTSSYNPQPPVVEERRSPEPIVTEVKPTISKIEPEVSRPEERIEDYSKSELDIDPFASVPEREVIATAPKNTKPKPARPAAKKSLSAAANALLLAAKAESAVGRHSAAITKVERALRIEPQSPLLWHQLADFNYKNKRYDQAISLARKSLLLSEGNRSLVSKNLDLMSKAATKEGDTAVFREVMDYKKMNP